jgi:hypothetical protein
MALEESHFHINNLELRAVRLALLNYNPPPQSSILVATDNRTVVSYINKYGALILGLSWKRQFYYTRK